MMMLIIVAPKPQYAHECREGHRKSPNIEWQKWDKLPAKQVVRAVSIGDLGVSRLDLCSIIPDPGAGAVAGQHLPYGIRDALVDIPVMSTDDTAGSKRGQPGGDIVADLVMMMVGVNEHRANHAVAEHRRRFRAGHEHRADRIP